MVTISTFKCIFLKYCLVFASTQMYFFASANAFQMLIHSAYFHIQISSDCNVHLHESVRTRVRALARGQRTSQRTPSKHVGADT